MENLAMMVGFRIFFALRSDGGGFAGPGAMAVFAARFAGSGGLHWPFSRPGS